jgi:hypothetical protein
MGAVPEWAPAAENHLLRSTSVIQRVSYGERSVEYRTFDATGTQVLRLNFKPTRIMAGGTALNERNDLREEGYTVQSLAGGDYVLRVRHTRSNQVSVTAR